MKACITFLLLLSLAAQAADKPSTLQKKDADFQGNVMQPYLMNQMSQTDDAQTKSMLMMMMMQSMMQQQSSQKASKENKKNEDKKEEKSENKVPTPGPMPSMTVTPPKIEENLKLVEEAQKQDEAKRAEKAEAEKDKPDPLADLPTFTPPKINLGLTKPTPTPSASEEPKDNLALGGKTALGAIQAPKGENLNFANTGNGNGTGNGLNNLGPNVMGVSKNNSPAQEVVGAERAIASAEEENGKGQVRKTNEAAAAGGDSDGGDESGEKGGGGNDEFFASLMAKMNGEDTMGMPEGTGLASEGDAAAGEAAPMSIFEFASMRYRRAANEEGRLRTSAPKKAEAAMR